MRGPRERHLLLLGALLGVEAVPREERPAGAGAIEPEAIRAALGPLIARLGGSAPQAEIMWPPRRLAPNENLKRRQTEASALAGDMGYEQWRHDPWKDLSRRLADLVLAEAAARGRQADPAVEAEVDTELEKEVDTDTEAELGDDAEAEGPDREDAPDPQPEPTRGTRASRPPVLVVLAVLALLAVVVGVVIVLSGDDDDRTGGGAPTSTTTQGDEDEPEGEEEPEGDRPCLGDPGMTAGDATPATVEAGEVFAAAAAASDVEVECALEAVRSIGTSGGPWVSQEVRLAEDGAVAALALTTRGEGVLVSPREWSYFVTARPPGFDDSPFAFYGRLVERTEHGPGAALFFEAGHAIAYPYADGPYFFVQELAADAWIAEGGPEGPPGLPMSDVHVGEGGVLQQEFQGGFGALVDGVVTYTPLERGFGLPDREELRGRMVTTPGMRDVSWYLTEDLVLTWVRTTESFEQCGGQEAVVIRDLHGAALQVFDWGGIADCG